MMPTGLIILDPDTCRKRDTGSLGDDEASMFIKRSVRSKHYGITG